MKNKKTIRFLTTVILCLFLILSLIACNDEQTAGTPDQSGTHTQSGTDEPVSESKTFTVAVHNGFSSTIETYDKDASIAVKADEVADKTFVCWKRNNEVWTYEKDFLYTVAENSVFRAVYAGTGSLYLSGGEGNISVSSTVKIVKETNRKDNAGSVWHIGGTPEIVGIFAVGDTLRVNLKPLTGNSSNFSYLWERSDSEDGEYEPVFVGGKEAKEETLTLTGDDLNMYVRVRVFGEDGYGGEVCSLPSPRIVSAASRNTAEERLPSDSVGDKTIAKSMETTLLTGYMYVLPVPVLPHWSFVGWYDENDVAYTDNKGASKEPFDGVYRRLYAQFEKNKTVTMIVCTQIGEEISEVDRAVCYIEDGVFTYTAATVADHECIGWTDEEGRDKDAAGAAYYVNGAASYLTVVLTDMKSDEVHTYTAKYKEAYSFYVSGGTGTGYYEGDDGLNLTALVPTGKAFDHWAIEKNGVSYSFIESDEGEFGIVVSDGNVRYAMYENDGVVKKSTFFVPNLSRDFDDGDKYTATFVLLEEQPVRWETEYAFYYTKDDDRYRPNEDAAFVPGVFYRIGDVTLLQDEPSDWADKYGDYYVTTATYLISVLASEEAKTLTPNDLKKMGVPIAGGCNVSAVFRQTDYILTYELDLSFLTETEAAAALETTQKAGYVFTSGGDGVYKCDVVMHYNDPLSTALGSVPELAHYNFDGWQMSTGGRIPSTMPKLGEGEKITLIGTYSPERFTIRLFYDERYGYARIGSPKGGSSGSYDYGTTVNVYVTARQGYQFSNWTYGENKEFNLSDPNCILQKTDEPMAYGDDTIVYYFSYFVTGNSANDEDKSIKVNFEARAYKLVYQIRLSYDGENVTGDERFMSGYTPTDGFELEETTTYYYYVLYALTNTTLTYGEANALMAYYGLDYVVSGDYDDGEGLNAAYLTAVSVPVADEAGVLSPIGYYKIPVRSQNGDTGKYLLFYPYSDRTTVEKITTITSPSNPADKELIGKPDMVLTKTESHTYGETGLTMASAPTAAAMNVKYSKQMFNGAPVSYWTWQNGNVAQNDWTVNFSYGSGETCDFFSMPSKDVTATGTISIRNYTLKTVAGSDGLTELSIVSVNGKDPSNYVATDAGISIPYGSVVLTDVSMAVGYSFRNVNYSVYIAGEYTVMTAEPEVEKESLYHHYITFTFLSGQSTTYSYLTTRNVYTIELYVRMDKENDATSEKLVGKDGLDLGKNGRAPYVADGQEYAYYKQAASLYYGDSVQIENLSYAVDPNKAGTRLLDNCFYTFTNWVYRKENDAATFTSMPTMPDSNVVAFTTLKLKMFETGLLPISNEDKRFEDEYDKDGVKVTLENATSAAEGNRYDYYTELTYSYVTPKGHTFVGWNLQVDGASEKNGLYETAYAYAEYVPISTKPSDFDSNYIAYVYRKSDGEEYTRIPATDSIWTPSYSYAYLRYVSVREPTDGRNYELRSYRPSGTDWVAGYSYATAIYTALDTKPTDWETAYPNYFVYQYVRNASPVWESGKKYASYDGVNYSVLPAKPLDWDDEYLSYYRVDYIENDIADWDEAKANGVAYRTFVQTAPMSARPADWEYAHSSYFIISSTPFVYSIRRAVGARNEYVYTLRLRLTARMVVSADFGVKTYAATVVSLLDEEDGYVTMSSTGSIRAGAYADGEVFDGYVDSPEKVSFDYNDRLCFAIDIDDLLLESDRGKRIEKITVYYAHNDHRRFNPSDYAADEPAAEFLPELTGDFGYEVEEYLSEAMTQDVFVVVLLGYIEYDISYDIYTGISDIGRIALPGYDAENGVITVTASDIPVGMEDELLPKFRVRYDSDKIGMEYFLTAEELKTILVSSGRIASIGAGTADSVLLAGWFAEGTEEAMAEPYAYTMYRHTQADRNAVFYGALIDLFLFEEVITTQEEDYAVAFNPYIESEFPETYDRQFPSLTVPDRYREAPVVRYGFVRSETVYGELTDRVYNFAGNDKVFALMIPSTVVSVEKGAFENCPNLATVALNNGIERIGENAFYGCSALTDIVYPVFDENNRYDNGLTTLTEIGKKAFAATALTTVVLPSYLRSVGEQAFADISTLENVYFDCVSAYTSLQLSATGNAIFYNSGSASKGFVLNRSKLLDTAAYQYYENPNAFATTVADGGNKPADFDRLYDTYRYRLDGEYEQNLSSVWKDGAIYRYVSYTETTDENYFDYYLGYTPNTSSVWRENVYYASGSLQRLTEKPSDWETAYATYITKGYVLNTSSVWTKNAVYSFDGVRYILTETQPDDWATGYASYYRENRTTGGVSPLWDERINEYYAFADGYVLLSSRPDDWVTGYGRYYQTAYLPFDGGDTASKRFFRAPHYELVLSRPDDWDDVFGTYFVEKYVQNASSEWQIGRTYVREKQFVKRTPSALMWEENYGTYYISGVTLHVGENATVLSSTLFGNASSYEVSGNGRYLVAVDIEESAKVLTIGEGAFGFSGLQSIVLPKRITSLANKTFYNCNKLSTVSFADDSVMTILPQQCFYGCVSLGEVTLPQSIVSIASAAFAGTQNLESVYYYANGEGESNLSSIGASAFATAGGKHSGVVRFAPVGTTEAALVMPDSLTSIGEKAFFECYSYTKVVFNAVGAYTVGASAFAFGRNLAEIVYNATAPSAVFPSSVFVKDGGDYDESVTVLVTDEVTAIPANFLMGANCVTELTIGKNVSSIGNAAFGRMGKLNAIAYNAENVLGTTNGGEYFYLSGSNATVTFGANVRRVPDYLFYNMSALKTADFSSLGDESDLTVGMYAFYATSLASLSYPTLNGLTIEANAFNAAASSSLQAVSVGDGTKVISIGASAFFAKTYQTLRLASFDLTNSTMPFSVATGSFVFSLNETTDKYDCAVPQGATVTVATTKMQIERGVTMTVRGTLNFNADMTVYGAVEKETGGVINLNSHMLTGAVADMAEYYAKSDSATAYSAIEFYCDAETGGHIGTIDIDTAKTVVSIREGVTLTVTDGDTLRLKQRVENRGSIVVEGGLTVDSSALGNVYLTASALITVLSGGTFTAGAYTYINTDGGTQGIALDDGASMAVTASSASALTSLSTQMHFVLLQGAARTLTEMDEDFSRILFTVQAGTTLTADYNLKGKMTVAGNLIVNARAILDKKANGDDTKISADARIERTGNLTSYYKTINLAVADSVQNETVVVRRNCSAVGITVTRSLIIDFNGKTVEFDVETANTPIFNVTEKSTLTLGGGGTAKTAATSSETAFVSVSAESTAKINDQATFGTKVTIFDQSKGTATDERYLFEVKPTANLYINGDSENAKTAFVGAWAFLSTSGQTILKQCRATFGTGMYVGGGSLTATDVTVVATSGYALYTDSQTETAAMSVTAEFYASRLESPTTAIRIGSAADNDKVSLNLTGASSTKALSVVGGTVSGISAYGGGVSIGAHVRVSAAAERASGIGTQKGAIVLCEGAQTAGKATKVQFGGAGTYVENTLGDAILIDSSDKTGTRAILVSSTAPTVTGAIAELSYYEDGEARMRDLYTAFDANKNVYRMESVVGTAAYGTYHESLNAALAPTYTKNADPTWDPYGKAYAKKVGNNYNGVFAVEKPSDWDTAYGDYYTLDPFDVTIVITGALTLTENVAVPQACVLSARSDFNATANLLLLGTLDARGQFYQQSGTMIFGRQCDVVFGRENRFGRQGYSSKVYLAGEIGLTSLSSLTDSAFVICDGGVLNINGNVALGGTTSVHSYGRTVVDAAAKLTLSGGEWTDEGTIDVQGTLSIADGVDMTVSGEMVCDGNVTDGGDFTIGDGGTVTNGGCFISSGRGTFTIAANGRFESVGESEFVTHSVTDVYGTFIGGQQTTVMTDGALSLYTGGFLTLTNGIVSHGRLSLFASAENVDVTGAIELDASSENAVFVAYEPERYTSVTYDNVNDKRYFAPLEEEPYDWNTNWTSYYVAPGVKVSGAVAPVWTEPRTYYKAETVQTRPDDWYKNYSTYFVGAGDVYEKNDGRTYRSDASYATFETLQTKPGDWASEYATYYYYDATVRGLKKNASPTWDDGLSYAKKTEAVGKPTDWATQYNAYYIGINDVYYQNNGMIFVAERSYAVLTPVSVCPDDWTTSYTDYYTYDLGTKTFEKNDSSLWAYSYYNIRTVETPVESTKYLTLLTEEPSDWLNVYPTTMNALGVKNFFTTRIFDEDPDDGTWAAEKDGLCIYDASSGKYLPAGDVYDGSLIYYTVPTFAPDTYYRYGLKALTFYNIKSNYTVVSEDGSCQERAVSYKKSAFAKQITVSDDEDDYVIFVSDEGKLHWDIVIGDFTEHAYYAELSGETTRTSMHKRACELCDYEEEEEAHTFAKDFSVLQKEVGGQNAYFLTQKCEVCGQYIPVVYTARATEKLSDINAYIAASGYTCSTSATQYVYEAVGTGTSDVFDGTAYYSIELKKTGSSTKVYILINCTKPTEEETVVNSDVHYSYTETTWENGYVIHGDVTPHKFTLSTRTYVSGKYLWKGYCATCETSATSEYVVLYLKNGVTKNDLKQYFTTVYNMSGTTAINWNSQSKMTVEDEEYYIYQVQTKSGTSNTAYVLVKLIHESVIDYVDATEEAHVSHCIICGEETASEAHTLRAESECLFTCNVAPQGQERLADILCGVCDVCGHKYVLYKECADGDTVVDVDGGILSGTGYVVATSAYANPSDHIVTVADGLNSFVHGDKTYLLLPIALVGAPDTTVGYAAVHLTHNFVYEYRNEDVHSVVCEFCHERTEVAHTPTERTTRMVGGMPVYGYICADCGEFVPYLMTVDHDTEVADFNDALSAYGLHYETSSRFIWQVALTLGDSAPVYAGENGVVYAVWTCGDGVGSAGVLVVFEGHGDKLSYSVEGDGDEKYFSDEHIVTCDGENCGSYVEYAPHRFDDEYLWDVRSVGGKTYSYLARRCLDCGQIVYVSYLFNESMTYGDLASVLPTGYLYFNSGYRDGDYLSCGTFEGKDVSDYLSMCNGYYPVPLCTNESATCCGYVLVKFLHDMMWERTDGEIDYTVCDKCGYIEEAAHEYLHKRWQVGPYRYEELVSLPEQGLVTNGTFTYRPTSGDADYPVYFLYGDQTTIGDINKQMMEFAFGLSIQDGGFDYFGAFKNGEMTVSDILRGYFIETLSWYVEDEDGYTDQEISILDLIRSGRVTEYAYDGKRIAALSAYYFTYCVNVLDEGRRVDDQIYLGRDGQGIAQEEAVVCAAVRSNAYPHGQFAYLLPNGTFVPIAVPENAKVSSALTGEYHDAFEYLHAAIDYLIERDQAADTTFDRYKDATEPFGICNEIMLEDIDCSFFTGLIPDSDKFETFGDIDKYLKPYGITYYHDGEITDDTPVLEYLAYYCYEPALPFATVKEPTRYRGSIPLKTNVCSSPIEGYYTDYTTGIGEVTEILLLSLSCDRCDLSTPWLYTLGKAKFADLAFLPEYLARYGVIAQRADWESEYYHNGVTENSLVTAERVNGSLLVGGVNNMPILYLGDQITQEEGKEEVRTKVYLLLNSNE